MEKSIFSDFLEICADIESGLTAVIDEEKSERESEKVEAFSFVYSRLSRFTFSLPLDKIAP